MLMESGSYVSLFLRADLPTVAEQGPQTPSHPKVYLASADSLFSHTDLSTVAEQVPQTPSHPKVDLASADNPLE